MAMWILAAVFATVGLPMVWLAQRVFSRDRAAGAWPRAPGVITSSSLEAIKTKVRDRNGLYYDSTFYRPVVRYTYTVGGRTLEGTRAYRQDDEKTSEDAAQRSIDAYPAQKHVEVLYDPSDPSVAYLEVRRSTGAVILLAFGCLWLALSALFVVLGTAFGS